MTIEDPYTRLSGEDVVLLMARYGTPDLLLDPKDYDHRFAEVCDAVCHLLYGDRYGLDIDDPQRHTSNAARRVARVLMAAAGIAERHDEASGRDDAEFDELAAWAATVPLDLESPACDP